MRDYRIDYTGTWKHNNKEFSTRDYIKAWSPKEALEKFMDKTSGLLFHKYTAKDIKFVSMIELIEPGNWEQDTINIPIHPKELE